MPATRSNIVRPKLLYNNVRTCEPGLHCKIRHKKDVIFVRPILCLSFVKTDASSFIILSPKFNFLKVIRRAKQTKAQLNVYNSEQLTLKFFLKISYAQELKWRSQVRCLNPGVDCNVTFQ